jgi:hypothetical protein
MSEKTDLLKDLGDLAKTLKREPPIGGTVAELKVLRTEWTAEVTALEEEETVEDDDADTIITTTLSDEKELDGGQPLVSLSETSQADVTHAQGNADISTSTRKVAAITGSSIKQHSAAVLRDSSEELVRFTALVTLHINAVGDDGKEQPVVVAGKSARIPLELFNTLRDRRLVKRT